MDIPPNMILRDISLLSIVALSFSSAFANNVVVPGTVTTVGNSKAPLAASGSIEIQELISSGPIPASPITVTGLSFRAAPGTGPITGSIGNLSIYLSTSPNSPNSSFGSLMSPTFANNVGKDKTLVFSGSNVVLQSAGCAGPAPCPFDINFVFQTPFTYSRNGGLLVDMIETGLSITGGTLDAASFNAPGGTLAQTTGDPSSATGTFAYQGNVVELTYTSSAPFITSVVNVASNIPIGMPNYGIARGSLFAVYGANLGPDSVVVSPLPLPITSGLLGTTVQISGPGGNATAPIYLARSDIVVAVLPSNAPLGNTTVVVTYKGQLGTYPITVTQSNFGIATTNRSANNGIGVLGAATVTFSDFRPVTPTNTAVPGDVLTIWGTGLGAAPDGNDTGISLAGNIGDPPQVFVGGVPSPSVSYWGRAPGALPGLDRIDFQVPPDAPLGCNVSIVVQAMNGTTAVVSNAPTIALADADGATCSDPTQLLSPANPGASSFRLFSFGANELYRATFSSEQVQGGFFQLDRGQAAALVQMFNAAPSMGTCYFGINSNSPSTANLNATPLNAGPSLTAIPAAFPALRPDLTSSGSGGSYQSPAVSPIVFPYPGGSWNLSSSGGPDVNRLNLAILVPRPVTWSAPSTASRSNPLTIYWSGGDSNGYVDIQATGQVSDIGTLALGRPGGGVFNYGFECTAPATAGKITIPASILQAMRNSQYDLLQLTLISLPNSLGPVQSFDFTVASTQFQTIQLITFTN